MSNKTKVEEIDMKEISELMLRVQHAIEHNLALSIEDMKLLLSAITTLCTLQHKLEDNDVTLNKLRKLLGMVRQSERRGKPTKKSSKKKKTTTNKKKKSTKLKPKTPVIVHKISDYTVGQVCPGCQIGKLYKFGSATLLRVTGHAPYEATKHVTEQLRCNGCQHIYKAALPASVLEDGDANQQYGYTARALMAVHKFFSGVPYYHQGTLSELFGFSVSASTIYDQCEQVANDIMPIFYELQRQAANAYLFLLDDTYNKILKQEPELREKRNGKGTVLRTGVYSSGLIGFTNEEYEIVLFETSLGHAGEHLDKILEKRAPELPIPITMSDASSNNNATVTEVHKGYCNAHCRRQFVDLEYLYPEKVGFILSKYQIIWEIERECKENCLTPEQRLLKHQTHSLPAMESLKQYALSQKELKSFEENSAWGKAIKYLLRHYNELTLFCRISNVPIDDNRMEETLKIPIRGRKTAHFYKTKIGAGVANVLMSIITTAYRAEINVYEYLLVLQRNAAAIRAAPQDWLPWNYEKTLELLEQEEAMKEVA